MDELKFWKNWGVNPGMIEAYVHTIGRVSVDDSVRYRIVKPLMPFATRMLEMAIAEAASGRKYLHC